MAWLRASWLGTSSRQPTKAGALGVRVCVRVRDGSSSPRGVFVLLVRKRLDTSGSCVRRPHTNSSTPVRTGTCLSTRDGPGALIRGPRDTAVSSTEHPGRGQAEAWLAASPEPVPGQVL